MRFVVRHIQLLILFGADAFTNAVVELDDVHKLQAYKAILNDLPEINHATLKFLVMHLMRLVEDIPVLYHAPKEASRRHSIAVSFTCEVSRRHSIAVSFTYEVSRRHFSVVSCTNKVSRRHSRHTSVLSVSS